MSRLRNRQNCKDHRSWELPLGLDRGGRLEKQVQFRETHAEHLLRLVDLDLTQPRERVLSAALACYVERLGSIRNPPSEVLHELALCDRHAMVHRLMVVAGCKDVTVMADCPACQHRLELSLHLDTMSFPRFASGRAVRLTRKRKGRVEYCQVRLPRPADVENAASERAVLEACIQSSPDQVASWLKAAERFLAQSDPLGHLEIVSLCPECNHYVSAEYDLVGSWLRRVRREAEEVLTEVHALAWRYHWSEQEVLRLPAPRRHAYFELCYETEPTMLGV